MNLRRFHLIYDVNPGVAELLRDLLLPAMGQDEFIWYGKKGVGTRGDKRKTFDLWPRQQRNQARVLCGARLTAGMDHHVMADLVHEITFYFEPAEFCARHYLRLCEVHKERGDPPPSLDHHSEHQMADSQTQHLCKRLGMPRPSEENFDLEKWDRRLSRMLFVATDDRILEWLPLLFDHIDITIDTATLQKAYDAWKNTHRPSSELIAHFRETTPCPIDSEIHSRALARQDERLEWLRKQLQ